MVEWDVRLGRPLGGPQSVEMPVLTRLHVLGQKLSSRPTAGKDFQQTCCLGQSAASIAHQIEPSFEYYHMHDEHTIATTRPDGLHRTALGGRRTEGAPFHTCSDSCSFHIDSSGQRDCVVETAQQYDCDVKNKSDFFFAIGPRSICSQGR